VINLVKLILIGIALALDAFGVALGVGCGNLLKRKQKIGLVFSFGFFQFLLTVLGAVAGSFINNNLFNISNYISGAIIFFIGILLLKEGYEREEACSYTHFGLFTYIGLGIGVSMDALGVGFSVLFKLSLFQVFINSLIIGLFASVFTLIALVIVKWVKRFDLVERYADYIGGIILLFFGLKMIFL
jgi:putative Mn2+ efflux pump MntP